MADLRVVAEEIARLREHATLLEREYGHPTTCDPIKTTLLLQILDLAVRKCVFGAGEWRPIETAPKDGRELWLGRHDRGGVVIGSWKGDARQWERLDGKSLSYDIAIDNRPTHWMEFVRPTAPEPEPPK
jgi:hypothetical protein